MTSIFIKEEGTQREKAIGRLRQRLEGCSYKPRAASSLQKLERHRQDIPRAFSDSMALPHLDSGLLASRTGRENNHCCFDPPDV